MVVSFFKMLACFINYEFGLVSNCENANCNSEDTIYSNAILASKQVFLMPLTVCITFLFGNVISANVSNSICLLIISASVKELK